MVLLLILNMSTFREGDPLTQQQKLQTGGIYTVYPHTIVCRFDSPRQVLSSSLYNGGYLEAEAIFNHRLHFFVDAEDNLPGGGMPGYLALTAEEYGLDPLKTTGLLTTAHMSCHAYHTASYKGITVEVIGTAGVKANGARAGEKACYAEIDGQYQPLGGTINLLVLTNANLSPGAMAKALISITEAKTAALQELGIISANCDFPATGTGTDGVVIACRQDGSITCRDAGTQSKLGELFCQATIKAVKESLALECQHDSVDQDLYSYRFIRLGLEPDALFTCEETQRHNVLFSITQSVWQDYQWGLLGKEELAYFIKLLHSPILQPAGKTFADWLQQKTQHVSGRPI